MSYKNPAIQKAIEIAGSQGKLASKIGCSQPSIFRWLNGGGVQSRYLPHIERVTKGAVTMLDCIKGQSDYMAMP